jgi:hypothetical protein
LVYLFISIGLELLDCCLEWFGIWIFVDLVSYFGYFVLIVGLGLYFS